MDYINYLIYVIPVVLIVLAVVFWPKKKRTIEVNENLIESIFDSIKKDNIKSVSSDISRVKIEVIDLEQIDTEKLKEISEGVFISGNSLKIMFKDSADDIVKLLKRGL